MEWQVELLSATIIAEILQIHYTSLTYKALALLSFG
jgi:hypothetical protein